MNTVTAPLPSRRTNSLRRRAPQTDAYWRACNYLCAGMLYLRDNPLLREPLKPEHIKNRLLGHWGSDPGQTFTWVHLNRLIKKYDLDLIYISGPGHGAPATLSNSYLEGVYSEIYPDKSQDARRHAEVLPAVLLPRRHRQPLHAGDPRLHPRGRRARLQHLARASAPPSTTPTSSSPSWSATAKPRPARSPPPGTPTSSSTPSATAPSFPSFTSTATRSPTPPSSPASRPKSSTASSAATAGTPYFVEGDDPAAHAPADGRRHWSTASPRFAPSSKHARSTSRQPERPRWPMIVLRSPKGWTGPKEVDGHKLEGSWRAHQMPDPRSRHQPAHLAARRRLDAQLQARRALRRKRHASSPSSERWPPTGDRRISANPHANGGALRKPLDLPDFRDYAVKVEQPGSSTVSSTDTLAHFLRDVMRNNMTNFRVFGPDETASNKLEAIYEAARQDLDGRASSPKTPMAAISPPTAASWRCSASTPSKAGSRATSSPAATASSPPTKPSSTSSTPCSTSTPSGSRSPSSSSAGAPPSPPSTSSSPRSSGARTTTASPTRTPASSTSSPTRAPRSPASICRPTPTASSRVADHCLRSTDYVNVIVADKQPHLQYLDMDEAVRPLHQGHRHLGLGQQRRRRRARRRHGLRRRHPHLGSPRRRRHPARALPRSQDPLRQRRRPLPPHARARASARPVRPRVRQPLHQRQASHLQLPRLRLAHPQAHLPPHQSRQLPRPRLQGKGQHQHAARARHPQPGRPLQPRHRRHRPRPHLQATAAHTKEWLKDQIIDSINYAHQNGIDREDIRNWKWPV